MFKIILHFFTLYLCFYSVFKKRNWVWMPGVWAHPCIKSGPLAEVQWVSAAWVCMHARGASVEMTLAGSVKVCLTGAATESALFFLPPRPPTVQSIQLLSPQGSRQSIKASGCILLTCAAPLMNSQHDPGWQAGNGCNKDCFCMLFASLINHLAVQQIREPHGNLISHGKGEAEESSGGKRAESGRATLFYPPPPHLFFFFSSPVERWSKVCGSWREGLYLKYVDFFSTTSALSTCLCARRSINKNRQRVQMFRCRNLDAV